MFVNIFFSFSFWYCSTAAAAEQQKEHWFLKNALTEILIKY